MRLSVFAVELLPKRNYILSKKEVLRSCMLSGFFPSSVRYHLIILILITEVISELKWLCFFRAPIMGCKSVFITKRDHFTSSCYFDNRTHIIFSQLHNPTSHHRKLYSYQFVRVFLRNRPSMVVRLQKVDFHCFVEWSNRLFYNILTPV